MNTISSSLFRFLSYSLAVLTMSLLFLVLFACNNSKAAATATQVHGTLSLIAGDIDGPGANDGMGSEARFGTIIYSSHKSGEGGHIGMATDAAGNIYLTDYSNHTVRKITHAGVVSTLAGIAHKPGSADGIGSAAQFNHPCGLAIDKSGNLYVSDESNDTIRKITPSGKVTTLAGTAGKEGYNDGTGSAARFRHPKGIALSRDGILYVVDHENRTIRKITQEGVVSTFAGTTGKWGDVDGIGTAAQFYDPNGITVDAANNVYVADNLKIRKILPSGVVITFVKMGELNSEALPRKFPTAITVDEKGYLYIASMHNQIIFQIDPSGIITTLAGLDKTKGYEDGVGEAARFFAPCGITMDSTGNLYVADMGNTAVRKITSAGVVTTLAGRPRKGGYSDGVGAAARFDDPRGIVADTAGNLFVVDRGNNIIRKITPAGVVTTLAGTPGKKGHADGKGSNALFSALGSLAIDTAGNLYVSDSDDSTIRKVSPDGTVTTLAGKAYERGTEDGPKELARFSYTGGITVNEAGDIYVTDFVNSSIRKIAKSGMVTTIAGKWPTSHIIQDGSGLQASFSHPGNITTDKAGNLYVTDFNNFNQTIRRITPEVDVSTFVGGAFGSNDGHRRAARFSSLGYLATDEGDNLYVADTNNHTIRKITPTGDVTTITGVAGSQGIVTGVLPGGLDYPYGLARISPNVFAITTGNTVQKLVIQ